jgi:hypothetical protein
MATAAPTRKRKVRRAYRGPTCPQCGKDLHPDQFRDGQHACRACGRLFQARRLEPIIERQVVVAPVAADGSTPCARHLRNASVSACGRCGVFMCQLCHIDSDGLVLCPGCFERLAEEGTLPSARKTYRDYGRMSSHLAVFGLFLMWPFGIVIGPMAIWTGIRGLRTRSQPGVRISKGRCVAAIVVGIISLLGFIGVLTLVMMASTGRLR